MKKAGKSILVIGCGILLLTGCGEKVVDYGTDGTEKAAAEAKAGSAGVEQFADAGHWTAQWSVMRENGSTIDIDVDADIWTWDVKEMYVIGVSELDIEDEECKEKIAGNIFDAGNIYYYDNVHLPKKQLEEKIDLYEKIMQSYADAEDDYARMEYEDANAGLELCRDRLMTASDEYTVAEDFAADAYLGCRNNIPYELYFDRESGTAVPDLKSSAIYMYPQDIYMVCPEEMKNEENLMCVPWYTAVARKNYCEMTEEEAKKTAEQFLADLGLEYPVCTFSEGLIWGSEEAMRGSYSMNTKEEEDERHLEGYVFYFDAGTDDVSFPAFGVEDDYIDWLIREDPLERRVYSLNARAVVYVTDEGVIKLDAENPILVEEVSEPVTLLPLETVQEILKNELEQNYTDYCFAKTEEETKDSFGGMGLIYFRLRDRNEEGRYSYVPAWRLSDTRMKTLSGSRTIYPFYPVLVNAVDGSVIHFMEEL